MGDAEVTELVNQVVLDNESAVNNYRAGNVSSIMFLVGQVMKKTNGKANPESVKTLLQELLKQ